MGTNDKTTEKRSRKKSNAEKRELLRNSLWPDLTGCTWDRHTNAGFTTVPRLLGLILVLIKDLSGPSGDASRVYLDLWLRSFDEGFVNVVDDEAFAYSSGYKGTRATRSWKERVLELEKLGFIKVKPRGNNTVGYILILDPLVVCSQLRNNHDGRVSDQWWSSFLERALEIGAEIPGQAPPPEAQHK